MIQDLASLCVTANEIDSAVGEAGEEGEDDELCHREDSKRVTLKRTQLFMLSKSFIIIRILSNSGLKPEKSISAKPTSPLRI